MGTFQQKIRLQLECQADSVGQRCQRSCSSRWDFCSDQLRLGDQDWPGFRVWESSHPWSGWGVLAQAGSDTRSQATRSGHKTGGALLLSPCGVPSQEGSRVGAQLTLSTVKGYGWSQRPGPLLCPHTPWGGKEGTDPALRVRRVWERRTSLSPRPQHPATHP